MKTILRKEIRIYQSGNLKTTLAILMHRQNHSKQRQGKFYVKQ